MPITQTQRTTSAAAESGWKPTTKIQAVSVITLAKMCLQVMIILCYTHYEIQEAMENFVFPNEIKIKLMKMSKLMNIFYVL